MTTEQVAALGPAFTGYLGGFRRCFVTQGTFAHLGTYGRGLLSDLARKSVEPIALASGCAVRTLQEFLRDHLWRYADVRQQLPKPRRCLLAHRACRRPGQRRPDR